jgi:hypothetical protein
VDQRGESHDLGVWLNQHEEGSLEGFMVGQLWNFALHVAKAANIEWRIVFAKLGIMGEREMNGVFTTFSLLWNILSDNLRSLDKQAGYRYTCM